MIVTHQISMNMQRQEKTTIIDAVQNDRYSRMLAISFCAGDKIWKPPNASIFSVRYIKSDGHGGEYDHLPDGTSACMLESNVLIVALAPQVLTTPGLVQLDVVMTLENEELSTFRVLINVHPSVGGQLTESEDYHYGSGYLPMPSRGTVGDFLQITRVNDQGVIIDTEGVDMEEYLSVYSFLPDVTRNDAGKVLRVDGNGEWVPEVITLFQAVTQEAYDALAAAGEIREDILYMIVREAL